MQERTDGVRGNTIVQYCDTSSLDQVLGFRVQGLGSGILGLGFWGAGFGI
jgi:hypothetical protein